MSLYDELREQGFELDHEDEDDPWGRTEVWINSKTHTGVAIEWFRLPEVAR